MYAVQPAGRHFEQNSRGRKNSFLLLWMGTIKLQLQGMNSRKELIFYLSYVIKRSKDDTVMHKAERDL